MAHDVFISHSSHDKPVADAICANLENANIRAWMAPRDICPGKPWAESIIDAIASSKIMIVIVSQHSNASNQVTLEVERAVNKGVVILPFRIDAVQLSKSLEYFLSSPHWLDAMTPPLKQHVDKLVGTVKILVASEAPPKPPGQPKEGGEAAAAPRQETPEVPPDQWGRKSANIFTRFWLSLFEDK